MHDKLLVKEETCVVLAARARKNVPDCLRQLISIALGQVKIEIW